ncbi:MAG: HEPN domain-containing protein [Candidatus Methanomethylicia archaeon]
MVKSSKAWDWLSMAEDDLRDARRDYEYESFASSVNHAELACQKALKALIVALGYEPLKTHKPSIQIKTIITGGLLEGRRELIDRIGRIISYAMTLEDQGTIPRYGWETINRIIKPLEIYDKEKTKSLLENAEYVFSKVKEILGEIDC